MFKSIIYEVSCSDNSHHDFFMSERRRIELGGDISEVSASEMLALFDQLCEFQLGRFLIINKGLNAFWTNELVTWTPDTPRQLHPLERIIFDKLPATQATRERYHIFCRELQNLVFSGCALASVPCGLMTDLLNLSGISNIRIFGIDLDGAALAQARYLAEQRGLLSSTTLSAGDAWLMDFAEEFDVLTSNGLNIYESSNERVTELYTCFSRALKRGGTLVTSFMTPPPLPGDNLGWKIETLDPALLRLQKILFMHVIGARWNALRTERNTLQQLTQAGFINIRVIYDRVRMYPTVLAQKP